MIRDTSYNYIEEEVTLENIVEFQQYRYNGKIITIMGEIHDSVYNRCEDNPISLSRFITTGLIDNPDSNVLLEYEINSNGRHVFGTSPNIKQIVETIESISELQERIVPVEFRTNLLSFRSDEHIRHLGIQNFLDRGFNAKNDLYWSTNTNEEFFRKTSVHEMLQRFVDPFFVCLEKRRITYDGEKVSTEVNNALKKYINIIIEEFKELAQNMIRFNDQLENNFSGVKLKEARLKTSFLQKLRILWMKVNDFLILPTLFNLDQTETFVLLGRSHCQHFKDIFTDFFPNNNVPITILIDKSNNEKCIDIMWRHRVIPLLLNPKMSTTDEDDSLPPMSKLLRLSFV